MSRNLVKFNDRICHIAKVIPVLRAATYVVGIFTHIGRTAPLGAYNELQILLLRVIESVQMESVYSRGIKFMKSFHVTDKTTCGVTISDNTDSEGHTLGSIHHKITLRTERERKIRQLIGIYQQHVVSIGYVHGSIYKSRKLAIVNDRFG